jgi:acetolactate synthase I/II/III large subunit
VNDQTRLETAGELDPAAPQDQPAPDQPADAAGPASVAPTIEAEAEAAPVAPATEAAIDPPASPGLEAQTVGSDVGTAAEVTDAAEVADAADDVEAPGADPATSEAAGPRSVGRLIADALRAAGVRYAFTVPGESFLGLLQELEGAGIRVVATRHEGGAAFMAEAYGQLTGRPAACLGTRAVGAANLAVGIHTAHQNSTPMFALVGQVQRSHRGREAFQEIDQPGSIGRLAKWAAEIDDPGAAAEMMTNATRQALGGRPGPVLLSLPEDVLDELAPDQARVDSSRPAGRRPDPGEVRAVLQLLASARRPVIIAGGGVLRARTSSDLTRFAELLRVPVIAAWRRGDVFPNDHPLYLGMAGYSAPAAVRARLERADAILVLGSRLNEPTTYAYRIPAAGTRWAHVDLAPQPRGSGPGGPEISVVADARAFLRLAVQRLQSAVLDAGLVDARSAANEEDRDAWEQGSRVDGHPWEGPGIHPGRTVATLRRVLPDEAIVTFDAGNFGGWAARGFRFRKPGTFLGPTSGAMGYALPAAIAAALVHRERPVIALAGDGGLAMVMAELETAVREQIRLVVLVFDNERYGTIWMHQDARSAGHTASDLGPIDFAAVARACGARGVRVESDEAFEPALRQALGADRPTVIHLPLDRRWVHVDSRP